MVRMKSCHGSEFTPLFGARACSDDEENASDEEDADCEEGSAEGSSDAGFDEDEIDPLEDINGAFADAKDRWKIDGETLKGFYLHSPTGQLFSWDQAKGVLYEYNRQSGECVPIWAAGNPQLSAEIWAVLPLPPTDPASLQCGQNVQSGKFLCILHISRARAAERAAVASSDFCIRLGLDGRALTMLQTLPPQGQAYVLRTFCAPARDASGALCRQIKNLQRLGDQNPWASAIESATVRVPTTGAVLGRCVPEIAALCWHDSDPVSAAHCRIACVEGEFSVCDLGSTQDVEDGTLFDGRRLGSAWAALRNGTNLDLGPVRVTVELKPVQASLPENLPKEISASQSGHDAKRPAPQRGGWRSAKRPCTAGAGAKGDVQAAQAPEEKTAALLEGERSFESASYRVQWSQISTDIVKEAGIRGIQGGACFLAPGGWPLGHVTAVLVEGLCSEGRPAAEAGVNDCGPSASVVPRLSRLASPAPFPRALASPAPFPRALDKRAIREAMKLALEEDDEERFSYRMCADVLMFTSAESEDCFALPDQSTEERSTEAVTYTRKPEYKLHVSAFVTTILDSGSDAVAWVYRDYSIPALLCAQLHLCRPGMCKVGLTSEDHGIADDQALRALIYQCLFLGTRLNASEFELSSPPPIPLTVTRGDSLENGNYWTFDERELSLDYLLPDDDAQGVAGLQEVQWPSWRAEKTAPGGPPSAYFPSPSSYFPSPRGTSQGGPTRSTTIGGFTRGTSQGLNRVSVVTRGVRETLDLFQTLLAGTNLPDDRGPGRVRDREAADWSCRPQGVELLSLPVPLAGLASGEVPDQYEQMKA
ncbi:unnamed protein product [Polarella glacialis]|uniref:FHA domain-containing protein n=1 Tax=Polarella glacialis TaxID=89957 RepID=A0A813JXI6_POLGL|nr:unnamed protein product [Polarella glacialis]